MMATYQKLQDHLGDRLGRDVHLISFTVDPDNDRPGGLNDHATRIDAKPGWLLLTGTKRQPDLRAREARPGGRAPGGPLEHLPDRQRPDPALEEGPGLAPVEQIIASLDGVIADRGDGPATSEGRRDRVIIAGIGMARS